MTLRTAKAPDVSVNAAKLIPWNDVRDEEGFRAKAFIRLDNAGRRRPFCLREKEKSPSRE
jgi:hypothetical protein